MKPINPKQKFWTYQEAAEYTGISRGTLYAWVHTGRVPHMRFGRRHVMFPVIELLEWLEDHRVGPPLASDRNHARIAK
jgi:excisionase family DNA binding protein